MVLLSKKLLNSFVLWYGDFTSWSLLLVASSCSSNISMVVVDWPSIITREFTKASAAGFLPEDFLTRRNRRFPKKVLVNLKEIKLFTHNVKEFEYTSQL